MGRFIASCAFGFAAAVASVAAGAVIVVSPGGPLATIQAGVDAAAAGDTVLVKAGVYEGVVLIPPGKDGLILKGKGAVVIDARADNGDALGDAIEVQSKLATIQGLTIRHAAGAGADAGDAILSFAKQLTVLKCRFVHCNGAGISQQVAGVLDVKGCEFDTMSVGILAPSVSGSVRDCVLRTMGTGIDAVAFNPLSIERCSFRAAVGNAMQIGAGADVTIAVRDCKLEQIFGAALTIDAPAAAALVFERNRCSEFARGIVASGDGELEIAIHKNRFERTLAAGAAGAGSCIALQVAAFGEIDGNRAAFITGGFVETGKATHDLVLHDDLVTDVSQIVKANPFTILGEGIVLENERVIRASNKAFVVAFGTVSFEGCLAKQCGTDGFAIGVPTIDTSLVKCSAIECLGEGLDNRGKQTTLVNFVAKKNRIDIANTGSFATFDATFATGGEAVAPEVD